MKNLRFTELSPQLAPYCQNATSRERAPRSSRVFQRSTQEKTREHHEHDDEHMLATRTQLDWVKSDRLTSTASPDGLLVLLVLDPRHQIRAPRGMSAACFHLLRALFDWCSPVRYQQSRRGFHQATLALYSHRMLESCFELYQQGSFAPQVHHFVSKHYTKLVNKH